MKFIEKHLSKNSSDGAMRSRGNLGEDEAVRVLKKLKYKIIERNFYARSGEIDIIARDGEYICFVEVRLRKTNSLAAPAETIDFRKRSKIIKTAELYAQQKKLFDEPLRFDAVLINADEIGGKLVNIKTEVIKNAFEAESF